MKKIKALFIVVALMTGAMANAQGLGDLLKGLGGGNSGSDIGSTIGNVLSGVFSKSDLTLQDLVGEYVSEGPAITFKSDNFLQQAGGVAGAAALETKLQPYYDKYGLTGMPMTIDGDGNFTMTIRGIKLSGTVEPKSEKGEFTFHIKVAGKMQLGQFTTYVEKSGQDLKLMFDAKKLKDLISTVGKVSGMSIAKTMTGLLDSYDGANIGFKMQYTGSAAAGNTSGAAGLGGAISNIIGGAVSGNSSETDSVPASTSGDNGLGTLMNILNRKK